jgi:hypothetical protein
MLRGGRHLIRVCGTLDSTRDEEATVTDALLVIPSGGWTVDDLDALPESHYRYELTDGALTVSPSRSSLHQSVADLLPRWAGRGEGPTVPEQGP